MPTTFRNGFYAGLLVAFFVGIWLFRLWIPENQVRLHSEHLVHQVERRNWSAVDGFLAPDFHDAWGDDRGELLTRLRMVGRFFFDLTLTTSDEQTQANAGEGTWRARVHVEGRGEAAMEIAARVNGLATPFVLQWRQQSWKPWDWKLVSVANESLELPRGGDF